MAITLGENIGKAIYMHGYLVWHNITFGTQFRASDFEWKRERERERERVRCTT